MQRVDFLAHLHRADLGRDRGAGPSGDHDRCQQHAEFAQRQYADEIDRVGRRAEPLQQINAALGDNAADEEIDQRDDRQAAEGEILEMEDDGRAAKARRVQKEPAEARHHLAEKRDRVEKIAARGDEAFADIRRDLEAEIFARLRQFREGPIPRLGEKDFKFRPHAFEPRRDTAAIQILPRTVDEKSAGGIESLDLAKVEDRLRRAMRARNQRLDALLKSARSIDCPASGETEVQGIVTPGA